MRSILILFFSLSSFTLFSQLGKVEIHSDARVDAMIRKMGTAIPPNPTPQIVGYRIQLLFDSNKKAVDEARNRFVAQFPKVDTYITFVAPNYILKAGDFRSSTDAERVKSEINNSFPASFLIKEMINLPRID